MKKQKSPKANEIINMIEELIAGVKWVQTDGFNIEKATVGQFSITLASSQKTLIIESSKSKVELSIPNTNTAKRLVTNMVPFLSLATDTNRLLQVIENQIGESEVVEITSFKGS